MERFSYSWFKLDISKSFNVNILQFKYINIFKVNELPLQNYPHYPDVTDDSSDTSDDYASQSSCDTCSVVAPSCHFRF